MRLSDLLDADEEVVDSYSVRVPTYVRVSKKTVKGCNLNIYRNLHHHHLNTQKKLFDDDVKPLLRDKPKAERVWIHYQVFAPRNGTLDTMNVGSIVDKYFSDTMVRAGRIPDDNQRHIVLSTFSFGGVCPMDGHAIATVNILAKEDTPMRVLLDIDEIQEALDAHVKTLGLPGDPTVQLSVNDNGEIEAEVVLEVKPKSRGGRPKGSKNKPTTTVKKPAPEKDTDESDEEESADVETPSEGSGDDSDSGGGDGATEDAQDTAEPDPKTKKGNLFGDADSESSESNAKEPPETESAPPKKTPNVVTSKAKTSIFDA